MRSSFGVNDSHLTLNLTLDGDSTDTEWYDYPDVDRRMVEELISAFAAESETDYVLKEQNYSIIDDVFKKQLNNANIHPDYAVILPKDSTLSNDSGLWMIKFTIGQGNTHLYNVYVTSLGKEVLSQMSGIIVTSAIILILMGFLIWYLLHWVGRLRTIEQMKDDFTHNMTHELKTPVAVAYSAADSMLRYYDQSDEARNKQFLKIIMQRLSFLSGMIENILSMSMERFKTMKLTIENVEVKPIVEEVAGMIELKADKPVKIDIEIPDNLSVMADSLHFGNVLSNLIDNAVKYSRNTVNIKIKADNTSIVIADNGIGIDKDNLPYIFDKFYRVTSGDRYEVGGYGLGLFYVKQIVELLGWSIEVTSKPGVGTVFTIKFKSNEKR
ncbi:MAG: HAMP domain-containing histidine kinase [Duncaniella sp.]|nr:HAMP domain-containing histidine kinase [Duncaniella sp.]